MATKRVGLSERTTQEVKRRPLDALFGATTEEKAQEIEQERAGEEIVKEKEKPVVKKPVNDEKAIAEKCKAMNKTARKTFALDPISVEAMRLYTFHNRQKLSEAMVNMMLECIPKELWLEARRNIMPFIDTPDDYLDDVKKIDIDSVYYHKKKNKK